MLWFHSLASGIVCFSQETEEALKKELGIAELNVASGLPMALTARQRFIQYLLYVYMHLFACLLVYLPLGRGGEGGGGGCGKNYYPFRSRLCKCYGTLFLLYSVKQHNLRVNRVMKSARFCNT